MTFDLISGLHMQIQTWHPPLRLCIHAKYYVKSGLTNVLKNANKTKNMHLFSIRIANYQMIRFNQTPLFCYHVIYIGTGWVVTWFLLEYTDVCSNTLYGHSDRM